MLDTLDGGFCREDAGCAGKAPHPVSSIQYHFSFSSKFSNSGEADTLEINAMVPYFLAAQFANKIPPIMPDTTMAIAAIHPSGLGR